MIPPSSPTQAALRRLERAARRTALRLRVDAVLARACLLLPIPLGYGVLALTAIKLWRLGPDASGTLLWIGLLPLALLVGGVVQAWLGRRPEHTGALALDHHHRLDDRITNALTFHQLPAAERTPFMDAAIDDALATATDLRPRKAAPLHLPRELPLVILLAAGLAGIALLEIRTLREVAPEKHIDALVMAPDDIALFRDMARELEQKSQDPEAQAAARRFNQLVEDIAQRRLDRREVFARMEQLERELLRSAEAEKQAQEEGLGNLARELERSDLGKPIAQAMRDKRLADAEDAMKKLAERLKKKQGAPTKAQLEKLRDALKKASAASTERVKRLEEERQKLEEQRQRLLKKKNEADAGLAKKDQQELDKLDRQLERLNREKDQAQRAQRQLSALDRELAKAAEDLMREMGVSAQDLEAAAQDINRMSQEEMSRKEKEDLRRRLQELRELVRQQGKGGQERMRRLMRFGERARGGQSGKGEGQGQGQKGQGQGRGQGQELVLGPPGSGAPIPMPGGGSESGSGQMPGAGQGEGERGGGDKPGGEGAGRGGLEAGKGHDSNLQGDPTAKQGQTHDVSAVGVDSGQGAGSSEVIYGAAQRGFVGRGYQRVYTDYRNVAEEALSQDEIPPGYRFYVQRYFQLIRPRE